MDPDELIEKRSDILNYGWSQDLLQIVPALPFRLASEHRPGPAKPVEVSKPLAGSYNICFAVTFDDGFKLICRFPRLGKNWFRHEQNRNSASAVIFIRNKIILPSVPIPNVLGRGSCEIGPYTIYEFVEGVLLHSLLTNPEVEHSHSELRPGITDAELYRAYRAMAVIWLDLYRRDYPRAGAIGFEPLTSTTARVKVSARPLTFTMNSAVSLCGVPPHVLPDKNLTSVNEYYDFQAELQFLILEHQRNNIIVDEEDCRKKYVARCLFRQVVRKLPRSGKEYGAFKLICDDIRPGNVLVKSKDDFTITGVIDWDFTYTAPPEFLEAAPWWLLMENPVDYGYSLWKFLDLYKPKLELFLNAMRDCEKESMAETGPVAGTRLSDKMAASMNNGIFWATLAMRKHYLFDDIYWEYLDWQFFGETKTLEDRIALMSKEERDAMQGFIEMKMRQKEEKSINDLPPMRELRAL